MIPSSLIWAAAQIRALGQILSVASQIDPMTGMLIAAGIVTLYTVLGGLLADVITDLVQGIVIVIGLIVLAIIAVTRVGGWDAALAMIEPSQLSFLKPLAEESLFAQLDGWLVPICGSMVAQELIARTMAARSAALAQRSVLLASGIYLLIGSIPLLLGLVGPHVLPDLADSEQFLPELARQLLPPLAYALFSGAMISAILSTVDSALLAVGSLAAHNIVPAFHRSISEAGKVITARISVVTAGGVALVIALVSDGIYDLVETATGWGTGAILVITSFGLFTVFGGARAALASLIAGTATYLVSSHLLPVEAPFALTIVTSLLAYLVFARTDRFTAASAGSVPAKE